MTKQIAVRLPEDLVAFVDDAVASGSAPSRASVVKGALERERRRLAAERDATILAAHGGHSELEALARFTAAVPGPRT